MVLDFEEEFMIEELKRIKPKKVLVQLPEGIKTEAISIKNKIEKLGIEVVFSGETSWGGCCLGLEEAKKFKVDLIIHFGHSEFIKTKFPVLYVEIKDNVDLSKILNKSLNKLKDYKKIGLSFAVQHRHDLSKVLDFYKKNNKEVVLSKKDGFAFYEGQVIGCEYSGLKKIENKVEAFVIIGNRFHSVGASLAVDKPVFLLDVYNDEVSEMSNFKDKIIRERAMAIDRFKRAKTIGIIAESKLGQKFGNYKNIIDKFREAGKQVVLISMSEITPEKVMNFYNIDAFIELACPRIAIDDYSRYGKPMLTYKEALVALGENSWEDLVKNGFL
ncbi:MAG: diphthamide biosynthesis enzyme Dph2 [archaeon]